MILSMTERMKTRKMRKKEIKEKKKRKKKKKMNGKEKKINQKRMKVMDMITKVLMSTLIITEEEQLRRQKIPFGPEKQVEESNTRYTSFNEYMQNNKGVKLVTRLNEVPALSFRAAKYLCPRRTGSSSRYLKRFNTYEHIMSKVSTRRQKRIIAMLQISWI